LAEREPTPEELIRALLPAPLDLNEEFEETPEPEIEGLPPRDKPVSEWTSEESEAHRRSFERTMREQARREAREQREEQRRIEAEANRTSAQRHGDAIAAMGTPGAKDTANAAFIASLHGSDAQLSLDSETPDYDGGVRDHAHSWDEQVDEHNRAVTEYFRRRPYLTGDD
jgi:hypothetical protein